MVATIEGHSVLVLDNKANLETLYEQSRRFGGLWYKCVVCSYARETRYINEVRDHIVSEHWDALNQAVNTTREEVVAGVEKVNCFKNALDNLQVETVTKREVMARREDSKLLQERLGQPTGARKKNQGGAVVKEAARAVQGATHHCN